MRGGAGDSDCEGRETRDWGWGTHATVQITPTPADPPPPLQRGHRSPPQQVPERGPAARMRAESDPGESPGPTRTRNTVDSDPVDSDAGRPDPVDPQST